MAAAIRAARFAGAGGCASCERTPLGDGVVEARYERHGGKYMTSAQREFHGGITDRAGAADE